MAKPPPANTNVIKFTGSFTGALPVSHILEAALERNLTDVVVIGRRADSTYCLMSSVGTICDVNWLLDKGKRILQDIDPCEQA